MRRNDITSKILKNLYCYKKLSRKETALFLRCNITTINRKMMKFGIKPRKQKDAIIIAMQKKIINIPKKKLKNLYFKKSLPLSQIAQKLNYDIATISREFKRHKILARSHSATMKLVLSKKKIKKSIIEKLYYKNHLNQEQIGQKLKIHKETIRRLMKEYGLKTRERSLISTRYKKYNFSGNLNEKAYLIGFRIGDLRVIQSKSKNLILVDCTSTKTEQFKLFKNLFKKYGHIWLGKPREDGNRVFLVRLNRSFAFLLPKEDNIPEWIKKNKNHFLSFFAGYTDAEGSFWISTKEKIAHFKISSYEKNILKQFYKQLYKIGVKCNPPKIHVKKGHVKSNGQIYKKDEWSFSIQKKSSLLSLIKILETRLKHGKRLRDLKISKKNIIKRNHKKLFKNLSFKNLPV